MLRSAYPGVLGERFIRPHQRNHHGLRSHSGCQLLPVPRGDSLVHAHGVVASCDLKEASGRRTQDSAHILTAVIWKLGEHAAEVVT